MTERHITSFPGRLRHTKPVDYRENSFDVLSVFEGELSLTIASGFFSLEGRCVERLRTLNAKTYVKIIPDFAV